MLMVNQLVGFGVAAGGPGTIFSSGVTGTFAVQNFSFRNKCVTSGGSGTQVRVTFKAGTGGNYKVNNASVGVHNGTEADTVAVPVELKFVTLSGFDIAASATITSDWATLTVSEGATLVVVIDNDVTASTDAQATPGGANGRHYYSGTPTYATADAGAGTSDGIIDGVLTIEVQ